MQVQAPQAGPVWQGLQLRKAQVHPQVLLRHAPATMRVLVPPAPVLQHPEQQQQHLAHLLQQPAQQQGWWQSQICQQVLHQAGQEQQLPPGAGSCPAPLVTLQMWTGASLTPSSSCKHSVTSAVHMQVRPKLLGIKHSSTSRD